METSGGSLVRLPLGLPFSSGEAIVARRECADHPEMISLCDLMMSRLSNISARYLEIHLKRYLPEQDRLVLCIKRNFVNISLLFSAHPPPPPPCSFLR